ncbi:hypothetical protein GCM10027578_17440 [Spirosoma luteolum]
MVYGIPFSVFGVYGCRATRIPLMGAPIQADPDERLNQPPAIDWVARSVRTAAQNPITENQPTTDCKPQTEY